MDKIIQKAYTYDDLVLLPQYSDINSRSEVDISTCIAGLKLSIPIIASNMDSVCAHDMAKAMSKNGGLGILHRYASDEQIVEWIKDLLANSVTPIPSVGVQVEDRSARLVDYWVAGARHVCIDIAHADHARAVAMVDYAKDMGFKVIAGNVATWDGTYHLAQAGADVIKIGVGPGAACTTRVVSGHGMPQVSAILQARACLDSNSDFSHVKLIADGGIRTSGDIVKALAAGAHAVMVGSLFAGCDETPVIDGHHTYRGMASREAQLAFKGKVSNATPEGIKWEPPARGPVKNVLEELAGGIRSGFSYSGARDLAEFYAKSEFVEVTGNGLIEGTPHALQRK